MEERLASMPYPASVVSGDDEAEWANAVHDGGSESASDGAASGDVAKRDGEQR